MANSKEENIPEQTQHKTGVSDKSTDGNKKTFSIDAPSVSLPKGGGAIRSIDEKFSVNAVNGTSSFSIPVPVSSARGFAPSLSLSYNSGSGNGIFGVGWSLSISSIRRKTEKELPQYFDAIDSDTYIISEAEDLVPEFRKSDKINFDKDKNGNHVLNEFPSADGVNLAIDDNFIVRRYRPRIEGLFSRMERWSEKSSGNIHWRIISKDNVTTIYGLTPLSKIADPDNVLHIFEWLPDFTYDDKGNCCLYEYKIEDGVGLPLVLHNNNRIDGNTIKFTNSYLKRIWCGNKTPYKSQDKNFPTSDDFMFETALDYGEHDQKNIPFPDLTNPWSFRIDAFSSYRSGFEIRTCRLCNRFLLYHHFNELPGNSALVKSLDLAYDNNGIDGFTFLRTATLTGYTKHDDGTYTLKSFPPFSFEYQQLAWNTSIQNISSESLFGAPSGIDDTNYQFTDLYSEGLSGILIEQGTGWFYKNNLGDGNFTNAKLVMPKPSFTDLQRQFQLMDLASDGTKQIVNWQGEPKGFFELNDDDEWESFVAFESVPNIDFRDPNTRQVDLNGDGIADLLITEDQVFRWYPSKGKTGYDASNTVARAYDEEKGPTVIFADATQSIFLADMSGDGLIDIVRIRNSDVCYWPNLGLGRFGAKVTMDNVPAFDFEDNFNPQYIKLADIDGSGTSDIIYLGQNQFCIWLNRQGNSFASDPKIIDTFPQINNSVKISAIDLLGTGLMCLVWNSNFPGDANAPLRYIDLMNSQKPHILTRYKNNLGKEVLLQYTASTQFYVADKLAGTPWVTKLHFPVHCVSSVITYDRIRKTRLASEYIYHHGYYDHPEREFRGFGSVDQTDSETINNFIVQSSGASNNIKDQDLQQPPILTKTWFHTGAFLRGDTILDQFIKEYFKNTAVPEKILPEPLLPTGLTMEEYREALRACKGVMLRKEVYALDENKEPGKPYITEQHNCLIKNIQPQGFNKYGIFLAHESESITYHYELNPQDPRTAQSFIFDIDNYGNILSSAEVVYARKTNPLPADEQQQLHIVYAENSFTNDIQENFGYRAPLPSSAVKYEVTGAIKPPDYFQIGDLKKECENAKVIDFEIPSDGSPQKRIFEITRSNYLKDDTSVVLDFGTIDTKALLHKQYKAAFNENTIDNLYNTRLNAAQLGIVKAALANNDVNNITTPKGGYIIDTINIAGKDFTYYWLHSGFMGYDSAHFFLPVKYADAFNNETTVDYDPNYSLFISQITDPKQNITGVEKFNYRTISAFIMIDMNANRSAVRYDELGMVLKTFVMGKKGGNEGDLLDETKVEIKGANDEPTTELEYSVMEWFNQSVKSLTSPGIGETDLDSFNYKPNPNFVQTTAYETHYFPDQIARVRKQIAYSWSDGNGKEIMKKVQAKPGNVAVKDKVTGLIKRNADGTPVLQFANPRWIGTGRTILNNKGNPVKQYEPFFSDNTNFEDEEDIVQTGVTPIIHYDPLDRVIKTDLPDGTFSRVEFDPWMQVTFDQVDTVLEPGSQWYIDRHSPSITDKEPADAATRAAWLSALLSGTPTIVYLDTLGRSFLSEQQNRSFTLDNSKKATLQAVEKYNTHTTFDIQGNQLVVTDAMNNPVMQYSYDMSGNKIFQNSMDAGRRWMLQSVDRKPLFSWNEKNQEFSFLYDELNRPIQSLVTGNGGTALLFDKLEYGDSLLKPDRSDVALWQAKNMLGKPFNHYDTAGLINNSLYDFKGNLLQTSRQLLEKYDDINPANWNAVPVLDPANIYNTANAFDALNRPWKLTTPDNSVQYHLFNESGHLEKVLLNHQGAINITPQDETFDALVSNAKNLEVYVVSIDYNEKAQRSQITYGNNTNTSYNYDQKTFRLSELKTTSKDGNTFYQDLQYTYDPVGNITQIKDDAQQTIYFGNTVVEPANNYTYDAIYQLVKATGREHIGQNVIKENNKNSNYRNFPFDKMDLKIPASTDSVAMRNYTQQFSYDKVGNILSLDHKGSDGNSYTRNYTYNNTSANNNLNNNRLVSTQVTGSPVIEYDHDVHGNMIVTGTGASKKGMPHLSRMDWNFKDELFATAQTVMNDGTPATTFYFYDSAGIRIRKITNSQSNNSKSEERIYLGEYEIFRTYDTDGNPVIERQTLHVMDDKARIVMVETKTIGPKTNIDPTDPGKPYKRYQYSNHLGSACLELDDISQIISYEEYHPYGTTSYQAMNADINPIGKRYRYTGLERDEENGFGYHNARYYVPWLGRWTAPDPMPPSGDVNWFQYVKSNPVRFVDHAGSQETQPPDHEKPHENEHEDHATHNLHLGVFVLDLFHLGLEVTVRNPEGVRLGKEVLSAFARHHSGANLLHQGAAVAGVSAFGLVLGFINIPLGGFQIYEGVEKAHATHFNRGGSDIVQGTLVTSSGVATIGGIAGSAFLAGAAFVLSSGAAGFGSGRLLDKHLHLSDSIVNNITREEVRSRNERDDAFIEQNASDQHEITMRAQRYKGTLISLTQEVQKAYEDYTRDRAAEVVEAKKLGIPIDPAVLDELNLPSLDRKLESIHKKYVPILEANRP